MDTVGQPDVVKFLAQLPEANMLSIWWGSATIYVRINYISFFNTNVLEEFNRCDIVQQLNLFTDLDKPAGPSL